MSALPPKADMCDAARDVRFGSKADICAAKSDVRFTPNSDRKSGFPHKVMSALPPKADMCDAARDVRFGPKADTAALTGCDEYPWPPSRTLNETRVKQK
jgi:hypothetical protein